MNYPPLLQGKTAAEYRSYFEATHCRGPITTFDGIAVRFRKKNFDHCFFESVHEKDDTFSIQRAERLLWIKTALEDSESELYLGWDNKRKQPAVNRRVAIVMMDYVVVIALKGNREADFVTAFVAGERALKKIRANPVWA